jgi:RimJ/RimL family protein N-acetyltransferase
MGFTTMETARLIIRRLNDSDALPLATYRNLPEVAWMQLWESFSLHDAQRLIEDCKTLEPFTPDNYFQFGVEHKESDVLIGDLYLKLDAAGKQAEIGYTFDPAFQGKGLATEALTALLDYGFTSKGLHRIFGVTDPRHLRSIALMQRLGMRQEAHFKENLWFKGAWADDVVFAILEKEWASE